MEITVQNYRQLRNSFDTSKLSKEVLEVFNDVDADFEDYLDLYTDARPENDGIRDVVNNHIKLVNKYFVDQPKTATTKSRNPERAKVDNLTELKTWLSNNIGTKLYLESDYSGPFPKKFKEERVIEKVQSEKFATKRPNGELAWMDFDAAKKWTFSNRAALYRDKNVVLVFHYEKPNDFKDETSSIEKPKKEKTYVIYWEGYFITRKSLSSEFSKTENQNLAYTWKESEKSDAEKVAKQFDGLVVTMDEALKMQELKEKSKSNREKNFPSPKKETLQDAILDAPQVRSLMPKFQLMAVMENDESEEVQFFIDKVKELEAIFVDAQKIDQETPLMDKIVKLHYFYGSTDWFIFDYDPKENEFFGYVILNGDTQMSEAGYISVDELQSIKRVELDFFFDQKELGKVLHERYPNDYPAYSVTKKKDPEPKKQSKTKPKAVIEKRFVDNFSTEFQLIRRFYNIIKDKSIEVPYNKTRLLFMAFNKAAIERKVRKTSDVSDIFNACSEKMRVIFEDFAKPTQSPVKVDFTDKALMKKIEEYVSDVAINPAVQVLKRFVSIQNTYPEIKKAEAIKKALLKVLENDKNNRLSNQLSDAVKWIDDYIKNPKQAVETEVYGLSAPRGICTNRIKCAGVDKSGKLHKGYKFQEGTGHIVKVRSKKKVVPAQKEATKKTAGSLGYSIDENAIETIEIESAQQNVNQMVHLTQNLPKEQPPVITPELTPQPQPETPTVKNKLMNMKFDSLEMDEGWEEFMQHPATNLKIGVSGKPKNGKTAGCLQLANYLSKFGPVLYNFADQGFNKSTKDLWIIAGLDQNPKVEPSDVHTLSQLEKQIATGKYKYVFIDLINDYIDREGITPTQFKDQFVRKYPDVGFILVFEVTKEGTFKGDAKWMHVVDAIAEVKEYIMEIRGRYGNGYHVVWEEGLQMYNPKKYDELFGAAATGINSNQTEVI